MNNIVNRIFDVVGPRGLLTDEAVRQRATDWRGEGSCQARAIVRPASTAEVSEVMKLCHGIGQSVVVQGGVTGLVHGTETTIDDVVISLERMTTIESCDVLANTITVQAGVLLQQVQERAEQEGFLFPIDLGSRGSCTIGGNIATNAGGTRVIRYGMMRQQVLGLEAVLADGTVLSSMNCLLKNNAGYDLKQMFIGSEGTLGIITRAVLRLQPSPRSENTALLAVPSFDCLPRLLRLFGSTLWGTLSAFEVMWQNFYRTVTVESGRHQPPLSDEFPFYVLVESLGGNQELDRQQFQSALEQASEAGLIANAVFAQSRIQRSQLWAIREETESIVQAFKPLFAFDISLPIKAMYPYIEQLQKEVAMRWPTGGRCVVFGHFGDGNLHVIITTGREDAQTRTQVERLVYTPLQAFGGSVSAEHGIGLEKRQYLSLSRNFPEIELMQHLKQMLDPKNLLNPGKVLPSPSPIALVG